MSHHSLQARLALLLATLLAAPLAAHATDLPHASPRLTNACADCHVLHNAPGLALTNVAGQFNLCSSCHIANAQAAWNAADQAVPGTSGSSHSWSGLVVSPGNGSAMPTSAEMLDHLDGAAGAKRIRCGTCHDPHSQARAPFDPTAPTTAGAAGRHFGRLTNTANELCLDCHAARNMTDVGHGFWTGAKLSHPVRTSIPASTEFNAIPLDTTGTAQLLANFGTSTGGTTTTLIDSTKAWAGLNGQWIRFTSGSNKNLTRQITATAATTLSFAALPVAVGAGVTYEIDADGNLLNNLVLSNAGTPSFTTGTVQCLTCHAVHYADSNSATYDDQPRAGDGNLLRRTNDDGACSACHTVKLHNSTVTNSSRAAWGTTFTCRTCHTAHDTANIFLVNESIVTPNSGTHTVDFRTMTDSASGGIEPFGLVNSTTPGTGPCETCHTNTRNGVALSTPGTATFTNAGLTVTGVGTTWSSQLTAGWEIRCTQGGGSASAWTKIATVNSNTQLTLVAGGYRGANCAAGSTWEAANPRFRNTGSGRGAAGTEHYAGTCVTCHTHSGGFRGGESSGNTACSNCHDFDMTVDDGAKTGKYHHVMETDVKLTVGITTYPTTAAPTIATADQDKSCVQCHADHNIFRPDLNASNSQGRGANLRTRIANGPPTGSPPAASAPGDAAPGYYANRDYAFADAAGGICLSCHTTAQTKNQADQHSDGSTVTPALTKAGFDASIHDYTVGGRITNGASTFTTACTKCHNDGLTKSYQDGTYKFSLHSSDERHLLSPMGIVAPPDPLEEKFCYRCHSAVADVNPGGGPAKGVTLRDYYNQTAMTARAEGIYAAMGKGTAGSPASATTSATVLYFKPTGQENPAEPMPNAHQTGDAMAGGSWIGRAMSPNAATVAYETKSVTANQANARNWNMVTFTSPAVLTATTVPAGNWTIAINTRESNTALNAQVRYRIYLWGAGDAIGTEVVARNSGVEMGNAAAPGTSQSFALAAPAINLAVGDKIVVDLELYTSTTTLTYTGNYYFGNGAQGSLTLPAAVTFNYASPAMAASGRHDVAAYSGLHRASRTDETLAYIAANKHVECADCHDPHGAGQTTHTNGTNLVSGALSNVSGVTLTAAAANWTAPAMGAALTTATKEYEICMKCHSSANTSLAAWNATWTNVALEFNTTNGSYHPVVAALPAADPGANGSSRLTAAQLTNGWTPGQTMYCSDCHGNNSATPAAQGPHGSAANFMLKGPNTGWPLNSGGSLARGNSRAGVFCDNCHPANNNSHEAHSKSDHTSLACVNCHLLIPHGGKLDRLIGDSDGTMPARYAYQGNVANMFISGFTKTTPANYAKSNCGTTAASGCTGDHPTANGADW